MSSQKQWGRTELKVEHTEYEWTIINFKLFLQINTSAICSPSFYMADGTEWCLKLYPQGDTGSQSEYISLFLMLKQSKTFGIKVEYEFSILGSDIAIKRRKFVNTYNLLTTYGALEFVMRSAVLEACNSDDTITIRCQITRTLEPYITSSGATEKANKALSLETTKGQLAEALGLLFADAKNADVTIIVGDAKFSAHKLILASRSSVFAAMFEQKDMEENIRNEVRIENMESTVIKGMLEFMYTDEVTDFESLATGLLVAADKYDLERLKAMCAEHLYKNLNEKDAAEIFILADLHQATKLKDYVREFIACHFFEVVETEGYKHMETTYPVLAIELTRAFVALNKVQKSEEC